MPLSNQHKLIILRRCWIMSENVISISTCVFHTCSIFHHKFTPEIYITCNDDEICHWKLTQWCRCVLMMPNNWEQESKAHQPCLNSLSKCNKTLGSYITHLKMSWDKKVLEATLIAMDFLEVCNISVTVNYFLE